MKKKHIETTTYFYRRVLLKTTVACLLVGLKTGLLKYLVIRHPITSGGYVFQVFYRCFGGPNVY